MHTGLQAWKVVAHQQVHCAEEGGEEQRTAHIELCEGVALQAQQQDCYGALEDALQVYAQLCTIHSTAQSSSIGQDAVRVLHQLMLVQLGG